MRLLEVLHMAGVFLRANFSLPFSCATGVHPWLLDDEVRRTPDTPLKRPLRAAKHTRAKTEGMRVKVGSRLTVIVVGRKRPETGKPMSSVVARIAMIAFTLLPFRAVAEPVTLKLAFFGSDRSMTYRAAVQPFIEAVNAEGRGLVEIVLYSGGVLGREIAQQPEVVLNGTADIAFVVPGYSPDRFPGTSVVELSGMFRDTREGTLTYTGLSAANVLKGYEDFVVLGAYVTQPESIHARSPITSIDDLKGKRIRVNNASETAAFNKLGAVPVPMQITQIAGAVSSGAIDGAAVPLTPLSDYGIKRVATHHYMLGTSGAPLALLINRKVFDALPKQVQVLILKYSGEWAAARFIEAYDRSDTDILQQLQSDPKRTVIFPSSSDIERAQTVFKSVIADWLKDNSYHQVLLTVTENELARMRAVR
jgi:TRAP-type C4-dicarboxylate transport system substrate-binding protein